MAIQVIFIICTSFLCLFLLLTHQRKNIPPGPPMLPLIGNLHQLSDLPHRTLQTLSAKYGPLMFLKLGSVPTLVISSADVAREVFKNHDLAFSGRPVTYATRKFSYEYSDVTLSPYNECWREKRKIVSLELFSTKSVQSFEDMRAEEVENLLHMIAGSSGPVDLSAAVLLLANNIICRAAFGKRYNVGGANRLHEILGETQNLLASFNISDFFPLMGWYNKFNGFGARLEKNFREMDGVYEKLIQEHCNPLRPKSEHEDLVDVLFRIQKDPGQSKNLDNNEIKGVIMNIFIAGTDTSSAALIWTMAELIKNPSIMRKAQEEVRSVVGLKQMVEERDISSLLYLKLVIKESLRLHPPVPLLVPRETTDECTINGYKIPSKTRVFVNAAAIGTDPNYWDNPHRFHPARFSEKNIDYKGQNFEFLPFGTGRRGCPGISYGVLVVELVLANLLHRFNWTLPNGMNIEDVNMDEAVGVTTHKKIPLCLIATPAFSTASS